MKNNSFPQPLSLFFKLFGLFTMSLILFVLLPYIQFGRVLPHEEIESGELVPRPLSGLAIRGSQVYVQNGCSSCHTQQIRNGSSDLTQGLGKRPSVPRDYINVPPTVLGVNRLGPDLSNIALREKSADWHHQHLFSPGLTSPGTIMPSYSFLYEKRKILGEPSVNALKLPAHISLGDDEEIIPSPDANALVAYLLSLNQTYSLPESPLKNED